MDGLGDGRFANFIAAADDMDRGGELDRGVTMDPVVLEINIEESHGAGQMAAKSSRSANDALAASAGLVLVSSTSLVATNAISLFC